MKLTTRSLRNVSFAMMVAVMPLAHHEAAAFTQDCGPYWCDDLCSQQGGYIYWRECDSCIDGNCGIGEGCYDYCIACAPDWEYNCLLPEP